MPLVFYPIGSKPLLIQICSVRLINKILLSTVRLHERLQLRAEIVAAAVDLGQTASFFSDFFTRANNCLIDIRKKLPESNETKKWQGLVDELLLFIELGLKDEVNILIAYCMLLAELLSIRYTLAFGGTTGSGIGCV